MSAVEDPWTSSAMPRIGVSGATRNFFKVGYTTLRCLSKFYPWVRLRLGVPDVARASAACRGIEIELVEWDPTEVRTLGRVLDGCTGLLMVPPIQDRVRVATAYVDGARKAGVERIVCLGVQYSDMDMTIARESLEVEALLVRSGIDHVVLHLPMFLENLLYQIPSIRRDNVLRYPCQPEARFAYVTCGDLGETIARFLAGVLPREALNDTHWTSLENTTCAEVAEVLSRQGNTRVRFQRTPDRVFIETLRMKGFTDHAARAILELWQRIEDGRDLQPNTMFAEILQHPPQSMESWLLERRCCFWGNGVEGGECSHPKPPVEHMM